MKQTFRAKPSSQPHREVARFLQRVPLGRSPLGPWSQAAWVSVLVLHLIVSVTVGTPLSLPMPQFLPLSHQDDSTFLRIPCHLLPHCIGHIRHPLGTGAVILRLYLHFILLGFPSVCYWHLGYFFFLISESSEAQLLLATQSKSKPSWLPAGTRPCSSLCLRILISH